MYWRGSPCGGCSSLRRTCFHRHCRVAVEEVGSCRGDQGSQRVGTRGGPVPFPDPSGCCRCPGAPGCGPSAAHPASSSPWPLARSCHHSPLVRPWRRRRRLAADPSPRPSGRRGCGCVCRGGRRMRLLLLCDDHPGSGPGACGHQSRGRGHCGRCCSTHHPS